MEESIHCNNKNVIVRKIKNPDNQDKTTRLTFMI